MDKFGYVDISMNSMNAYDNDFKNKDEFRRELQGKSISATSILAAAKVAQICKYNSDLHVLGVHSIYLDKGVAYLGKNGHATIKLSWDAEAMRRQAMTDEINKLTTAVKALTKALAKNS